MDRNIITLTSTKMFDEFYENADLTFEGAIIDEKNFNNIEMYLKDNGCEMEERNFFVYKGELINRKYGLSGKNAYNKDLDFITVRKKDLKNPEKLGVKRYTIAGRWFNDIIEKNIKKQKRENQKGEEYLC